MTDNKYVIVTVVNRETSVNFTETLEQAKELMRANYSDMLEDMSIDEEFDNCEIYDTSAYISSDDLHYDIDIFEIK